MKAILLSLGLFSAAAIAQVSTPPSYIAHEWGTFTSVQGADGVQMDWNPLVTVDLPEFDYNWANPGKARGAGPGFIIAGKTGFICRQRMETPVIYFYSHTPRDVDVAVNFPAGKITEWYPESATPARAQIMKDEQKLDRVPSLLWEKVHVLAEGSEPGAPMASDKSNSHYFAARETDSNLLQITSSKGAIESEKFLFYRGIGGFQAPVTVKLEGADHHTVRIENRITQCGSRTGPPKRSSTYTCSRTKARTMAGSRSIA
jgi:hypothetical protein